MAKTARQAAQSGAAGALAVRSMSEKKPSTAKKHRTTFRSSATGSFSKKPARAIPAPASTMVDGYKVYDSALGRGQLTRAQITKAIASVKK